MDAEQDRLRNPMGMDEACENCPDLTATRSCVVHGYGQVDADFIFIGETPTADADTAGIPFSGIAADLRVRSVLESLGFIEDATADTPDVENAYLTYLARCRHPDRPPTDAEVGRCDPYLTAEIRMINPEIIVPIGQRALRVIAAEYTTLDPTELSFPDHHATELRGRGFELLPMIDPARMTDQLETTFVHAFQETLDRDYRQTKGRRGAAERDHSNS